MILFLHGTDSYRMQERLQFLRSAFQEKYDEKGMNVSTVDGANIDIDEFRKHVHSLGLFSQKRFVVLRNPWSAAKDLQEQLITELDRIGADTILCVVADPPPRKDNKLFKRLSACDKVEEYNDLSPTQLRAFIRLQAKEHGASSIEPAAVELLAANVGNDLWRMSTEIKRLAHYDQSITAAAVRSLVDAVIDDNIFNLTDAIGQRNAKRATTLLEDQFATGANEQYLIAMLGKHIGTLIKALKTNGKGLKLHPYVLRKALDQSRHFDEQTLLRLYWRLLEIDEQLKTTNADGHTLLQLFVLDACRVPQPTAARR